MEFPSLALNGMDKWLEFVYPSCDAFINMYVPIAIADDLPSIANEQAKSYQSFLIHAFYGVCLCFVPSTLETVGKISFIDRARDMDENAHGKCFLFHFIGFFPFHSTIVFG